MSESIKDQLLNPRGAGPVEAELDVLRKMVESEQRRARRLVRWTLIVWAVWIAMIALMFIAPILAWNASGAPSHGPTTMITATAPASMNRASSPGALALLAGMVFIGGALGLPVIGVILLVLTVFGQRSANAMQIRASLASIDAQLRLLAAGQRPTSSP